MEEKTVALLNEISQNAEMGKNTVRQLLNLAEDDSMRHHLHKQLATYEDLSRRAHAMLATQGVQPQEQSAFAKASAGLGISMQTLRDHSAKKMAEMLIEGSNMGVSSMNKALAEAQDANIGAVALAQRLQDAEQQYAQELTSFL